MNPLDDTTGRDRALAERFRAWMRGPRFPAGRIEARIRDTLREEAEPREAGRDARAGGDPQALRPELAAAGRGETARRGLGRASRVVLAGAAAVLLFLAGMEYGRARAPAPSPGPLRTAPAVVARASNELPAALRIQAAGSRYVATLARFSQESQGVSEAERRAAREVATTILYAAALELLMEAGEDELMENVAWLVALRREGLRQGPRGRGPDGWGPE